MTSPLRFAPTLKSSHAFALVQGDIKSSLGHAYMVISPDDDAVKEFFTVVAAAVNCATHDACLSCERCKTVLHGNNPDVVWVNTERAHIKVDTIREMLGDVVIKSIGERKLYFVERFDLADKIVQNKLLKTLEEPPSNVTIFLGVANETAVLDTVKSRCRHVYLDTFSPETVQNALVDTGISVGAASVAAVCSEGQLGRALKIAQLPSYAALYTSAIQLLGEMKRSTDVVKCDNLKEIQSNPMDYLNILDVILRDMLVVKRKPELVVSGHMRDQIQQLSQSFSERAIAECIFALNDAKRKLLSPGANTVAAIDSLFFSILEAKHKWQL